MKQKWSKKEIISEIISYAKVIMIALAVTYIANHTLIVNANVPSGSMENTIKTGSRIIINRLAYRSADPKRGDIISFDFPDDESQNYLKRIIALPGETIEGKGGEIYINGQKLEEDYIKEKSYMDFGPYTVPDESYFVMGDNRNDSWDSRFWRNTYVHIDKIVGKAEFEYFPEIKKL